MTIYFGSPKWKKYRKVGVTEMRPYVEHEDLTGVSVSGPDIPQAGGMIARNPANPKKDRWYVAKEFYEKNYVEEDK